MTGDTSSEDAGSSGASAATGDNIGSPGDGSAPCDNDNDAGAKRRRLRRGDIAPGRHPALTETPEEHSPTNHRNHWLPGANSRK
ncbi:hypothetical protein V7S43_016784 [Phytophthora oleae]|uniref:Uncharacterized protein n=1 Tax=Phytophthora oleae TaxID=2107226 RepID=A0ABD3EUF5_9STRA